MKTADGKWFAEPFLVDSGADRTTISIEAFQRIGLPTFTPPGHRGIIGLGGSPNFQMFHTTLRLQAIDRAEFLFSSDFVVITDPGTLDFNLLGRDVLDQFDVILSRRNSQVFLIDAGSHYTFSTS